MGKSCRSFCTARGLAKKSARRCQSRSVSQASNCSVADAKGASDVLSGASRYVTRTSAPRDRRRLSSFRFFKNLARHSESISWTSVKISDEARTAEIAERTSCRAAESCGSWAIRSDRATTIFCATVALRNTSTKTAAQPGKRPKNSSNRSSSTFRVVLRVATARKSCTTPVSAASEKIAKSTAKAWARRAKTSGPMRRRLCSIRLRYEAEIPADLATAAWRKPKVKRRSRTRDPVNVVLDTCIPPL